MSNKAKSWLGVLLTIPAISIDRVTPGADSAGVCVALIVAHSNPV